MILSERHIISKNHIHYQEIDRICFLSKNLYNAGLYSVRQFYFKHKKFLTYQQNQNILQNENNVDYRSLPAKVSQQTLKIVEQNFKSFFGLLKLKNKSKINIPKYLKKNGRQVVIYTNQAISKKLLKDKIIKLSGTNVTIRTKQTNINQVRLVPKLNHYVVEVLYEVSELEEKIDNGRYCSIDLGLNNLATIGSNIIKPIIINGKPLKSINQYYNKKLAKLKSELKNEKLSSNKIKKLTNKRNNKINDYLHKASRYIVNHLVSNEINTLVVGHNKEWKQDINIGKKNNQNFVQVPHSKFIALLKYKCKLIGIKYILNEESYTSKCSFLDNEPIKKHNTYIGKRIKRGLFKTKTKKIINADLNGSLNILKKAVGEFKYPIEVCSAPLVYTIKFN